MKSLLLSSKRLRTLLACDMLFQLRYGFYFLYAFFSIFYAVMLSLLPQQFHAKAVSILVFTDPAAMGLFFMGAIVLFEKSQRVIESLSISPIHIIEYIFSKVLSIALISLISALLIALSVYIKGSVFFSGLSHFILFSTAIVLSSILFSLLALGCAALSKTLNQFMIFTIPFEVLLMTPPILLIFGLSTPLLEFHPGIIALRMIGPNYVVNPLISILLLVFFILFALLFASRSVKKMMLSWGGIVL